MQYGRVKDAAPYGVEYKKAAVRHPRWGGDGGLTADAVEVAPSADGDLGRWGISRRARRGCFAGCGQRDFARCDGRPEALPLDSAIF